MLGERREEFSPSLFVHLLQKKYLVNAGEGLQRLAVEHKLKLARIRRYLLLLRGPTS